MIINEDSTHFIAGKWATPNEIPLGEANIHLELLIRLISMRYSENFLSHSVFGSIQS